MKKKLLFAMMVLGFSGAVQAASNPLAMGGRNSNTPVEINADSLEVLQEKNQAIFTGHVVAIQGNVRLKAEKMTVHYRPQSSAPKEKANAAENAIRKIDVDGNVFLSTPEETASGTSGIYDVGQQKIFLNDRVVLTRGKNTLKGDKLVYDLAMGKSTITGGAVEQKTGKERVRALFVPEEKDKQGK